MSGPPGPVERAIRLHVHAGEELATPTGAPFIVRELDSRGIVLLLGKHQARTRLPWRALEEIPSLLAERGWVRTTGSYDVAAKRDSLSEHLKRYVNRETANWVAVVLEQAGIIEIDRTRPIRARRRDPQAT